MGFIVADEYIAFDDYSKLSNYKKELGYTAALISLLDHWFNDDIEFIEFTTSGSTGVAKRILHSKDAILRSASLTQKYFGYEAKDKTMLCLPLSFIAGKMMVLRSVISNLDLILKPASGRAIETLEQNIDFLAMTPMQFNQSFKYDKSKFSYIKTILLGGSPVSDKLKALIDSLNVEIYHSYGMTETITHVAVRKLNYPNASEDYISIDNTIRFSTDNESSLIIHADHLQGPVHTNDIVDLINEKSFVWIGRKDNVINSGGIKINPEAVEKLLSQKLEENFIVFGEKDELLGEKLSIIVESESNEHVLNTLKNIDFGDSSRLKPRCLYLISKFVFTSTGKIDRMAIIDFTQNLSCIKV